jgi:hypothetical protein
MGTRDRFIEAACEQFGLTAEQAGAAYETMRRLRVLHVCKHSGGFTLAHGALWDRAVLLRAAESIDDNFSTKKEN